MKAFATFILESFEYCDVPGSVPSIFISSPDFLVVDLLIFCWNLLQHILKPLQLSKASHFFLAKAHFRVSWFWIKTILSCCLSLFLNYGVKQLFSRARLSLHSDSFFNTPTIIHTVLFALTMILFRSGDSQFKTQALYFYFSAHNFIIQVH